MTRISPPADFRGRFTTGANARKASATASGPYAIVPEAVASPLDLDDLRSLVRWSFDTGAPLVPRGAATGMPGGNVGPGVAVELGPAFRTVGAVDPGRRTIRVGAGAVAGDVERLARGSGLFLPPLPSSADRCTVGGMAANNSAGARSFRHGAVRDWIHALDVVLSDGRLVHLDAEGEPPDPFPALARRLRPRRADLDGCWPRVRKNSSGYALDRYLLHGDPVQLVVGSEGTLGFITGVTLKLAPAPPRRALVLVPVEGPEELLDVVRMAGETDAEACEFFGRRFIEVAELEEDPRVGRAARGAYALVLVELAGDESEVESGASRLRDSAHASLAAFDASERARLWQIRHAASPLVAAAVERGLVSMQFIEDSVVPPERLTDYLEGLDLILRSSDTDAVVFGHAGDANVHVNPLVDVRRPEWVETVRTILDATVDLVASLGGTLSGEHGDGRVRAPFLGRIWPDVAVEGFREVKEALDPRGVLNPGVVLPCPDQDPLEGIGPGVRMRHEG